MSLRPLVVLVASISLLPLNIAQAEPAAELDDAVEGPAEGPAAAPAPAAAAPLEPEYRGNGLLYAAIGVTAFSWVSRLTSLGLTASLRTCTDFACNGRLTAAAAFLYMAPISQFIATGLVVPGGVFKGRHDGWRQVTTGAPARDGKTYMIAGGVVFGVFTALSIALRPVVLTTCLDFDSSAACGGMGGIAGYYLGVQASDTLSTVGAGLLSYGVANRSYRRRYGSNVRLAPFGSGLAYGLSLSGQF